jgi:hypothetical protein
LYAWEIFLKKGLSMGRLEWQLHRFALPLTAFMLMFKMGGQVLRFVDVGCPLLYDQTGKEFGNS